MGLILGSFLSISYANKSSMSRWKLTQFTNYSYCISYFLVICLNIKLATFASKLLDGRDDPVIIPIALSDEVISIASSFLVRFPV